MTTHGRIVDVGARAVRELLCNDFEVVYVDDGSTDTTYQLLRRLSEEDDRVKVIRLSANFGHQSAIVAGYTHASGSWICSIDADLQDPPEVMLDMLRHANNGVDIVFAVRTDRVHDSWFKRTSAALFYQLVVRMGVKTIPNHADFRLFTSEVRDVLLDYVESNLFLRATFANMGFQTAQVYYARPKRAAGETKYPIRKMVEFAISGITSFSIVPLRICTLIGFLAAVASLTLMLWSIYVKIAFGAISGWTSIVSSLYLLGGIQMMFIGILGEYIGKIYIEVKRRPRFIIRSTHNIRIGRQV